MNVREFIDFLSKLNPEAEVKVLVPPRFGPGLCGNYGTFEPHRHVRHLDRYGSEVFQEYAEAVFIGVAGEET